MEQPPWLQQAAFTRRGLHLALARCIYEIYYKPEGHRVNGEVWTFDTRCSGDLVSAASALEKSRFISYINGTGRRRVFNCGPDGLDALLDSAKRENLSDKAIEEAMMRPAKGSHRTSLEIEWLAE